MYKPLERMEIYLNKLIKRAAISALALITATSMLTLPSLALYKGVLGDVYAAHSRQLGAGVDFTEYRSVTDGLNEHAYLFEYRPDEGSLPLVSYGDKLIGSTRVTSLAELESEKGYNVIGGVNGDFFSMYTGIPMGALIRDGRIISDDDQNNAVGFTYNGETIFGDPGISFTVTHTYKPQPNEAYEEATANTSEAAEDETEFSEEISNIEIGEPAYIDEEKPEPIDDNEADASQYQVEEIEEAEATDESDTEDISEEEYTEEVLPLPYFNKYPTEWGAYLLDNEYADSTKSKKNSLEIVITLDDPESYAKVGATLDGAVTAVNNNATDTAILPGTLVISVCETSPLKQHYGKVSVGDRIRVEFTANESWENVQTAVGGSDVIIKDGVIDESVIDEAHEKTANPRTAVGVRADGTVIFFAVDGRSDKSYGLRMISLARTLEAFGCVYAINLDGGGSTTAVIKVPGTDKAVIANSASDGAERAVSNALLLVNTFATDNIPKYIVPDNTEPVILPGEGYSFEGRFFDTSMTEIDFDVLKDDMGEDFIPLSVDDVRLEFDYSRLSYYTDETMPELGTISDDGKTYTANGITGEIPLLFTAEYGDETLTGRVILFVAPAPDEIIVDIGPYIFTTGDTVDIEYEAFYRGKPVPARPGDLGFTLTESEVRSESIILPDIPEEEILADCLLGYIDLHGNFIPYENADGSLRLTVTMDPFTVADTFIIVGSGIVTALEDTEISYDFSAYEVLTNSDEATENTEEATEAVTEEASDTEETEVISEEFTEETTEVDTAEIIDDEPDELTETDVLTDSFAIKSEMSLYGALSIELYTNEYDLNYYARVVDKNGDVQVLPYVSQNHVSFDPDGSRLLRLALDKEYTALLDVLCVDAETNAGLSGSFNARAEINYDDAEIIFADTKGHWARKNINTLYKSGIVGGEKWDDTIVYRPERSLTRAEFATMICRVLELDTENAVSPVVFDDADAIPEWALGYINAVSELGIMNGKRMPDDSLCFDATGLITRQEIMQVIGNIIRLEENKNVPEPDDETKNDEEILIFDDPADDIEVIDEVSHFADAADIAGWAYENVLITVRHKIITGYSDNTIKPTRNVTRAEAATVILRAKNYLDTIDTIAHE